MTDIHRLDNSRTEVQRPSPPFVWLDTARPDNENGSCLLFSDPVQVLVATSPDQVVEILDTAERWTKAGGYAAGFLSYEAGTAFLPVPVGKHSVTPLVWFGLFENPIEMDARFGFAEESDYSLNEATFAIDFKAYGEAMRRIKELIHEGDVYQINFTDKIAFEFEGDTFSFYSALRQRQKVAYSAYIETGSFSVLSLSPELFFRQDGDYIVTRPMKGTIRRGKTSREDHQLADILRADPKSRAENVMIVDLLRNDLSRICQPGSVRVPKLFSAEQYETLHQMTSTVDGTLLPGTTQSDIFQSLFPCGSVTGAPKIRAMKRIVELERGPRGVYCGAIGYMGPERRSVFSVAIRTAVITDGRGEMGTGSGIVWDSDSADEYRECELKAQFLMRKISPFELIESIRWENSFEKLQLHLARMSDSARLFGIPFNANKAQETLNDLVDGLESGKRFKLRLLLNQRGELRASAEIYPPVQEPLRIGIAKARVDSQDAFFYHKTTQRATYSEAFREAQSSGWDEAILLNERGEVAEGTRTNLFVKLDGTWITPSIDSGLLAGIQRNYEISKNPDIIEDILFPADLYRAEEINLTNALMGRVRAVIAEVNEET